VSEIGLTRSCIVLLVATAMALSGCQAPLDARETGTEALYLETEQVPINNCGGPAAVTIHRLRCQPGRHLGLDCPGPEVWLPGW
jgi:hypothetical protein